MTLAIGPPTSVARATTPAPRTGSTPPPSPSGRSATTNAHWTPTVRRSPCSTSWTIGGDWRCATCCWPAPCSISVTPPRPAFARTGVDHARRAGDRHVLGIALTQIAQIAIAGDDAAAAVSAASEALDLQERIGYTEGIVSALHVLGHGPPPVAVTSMRARRHHRRALGLASRIGHAAAMCEAVEDLARDEVGRPAGRRRHAAPSRASRAGPPRPAAAPARRPGARRPRTGAGRRARRWLCRDRPFSDLVAEMAE